MFPFFARKQPASTAMSQIDPQGGEIARLNGIIEHYQRGEARLSAECLRYRKERDEARLEEAIALRRLELVWYQLEVDLELQEEKW